MGNFPRQVTRLDAVTVADMSQRRAIIYCRVSNDPTGQARSVSSQEAECRAVCEREGWTVADVLVDNDAGASRWSGAKRPSYDRLADTLTAGDVLVTWEASRAQRDLAAYVQLRDLAAERGVLWSYSGRTYDLNRGDDRFGTGLDALMAEREADQIRERVLRGKRDAAQAGRPAGRPPYGYRRRFNARNGRPEGWEIDENDAPVVREIARRVLAGETIRGIAADLNRRGVPAPKSQRNSPDLWVPRRLRIMLMSPSYAALRQHQGEVVGAAEWPAIIDEPDWHRIQGILEDPDRRVGPGPTPAHLLSGIARCGVCGATLRWFGPKSIKTPRYQCSQPTACVGRRFHLVDELVTEVVIGRLSMPDAAEVFATGDDDQHAAVDDLRALRDRLDSFADAAAAGEVSPAAFARIESRLLPQIDAAAKRAAASLPTPVAGLVSAADVRAAWEGMSVDAQREAVRCLVDVTVHPSSVGNRQFNPEDIEIRWKS